ncbi:MAG: hypothetical protein ACT4OE_05020 [Sphingosinicella sp.]
MPRHDPAGGRKADYDRAAAAWARYKRSFSWMVLATAVVVGLSLLYLGRSGEPMPWSFVIAVIAGIGLTMLVGTGLMGLIYLSHRSGHDEGASQGSQDD